MEIPKASEADELLSVVKPCASDSVPVRGEEVRPVPLVAYRLSTWLTHPNGTVAPQGSYRLEFL